MKTIFVRNLDFAATEDQLRSLFGRHGTVEKVTLVRDQWTRHPRGFAFVEMTAEMPGVIYRFGAIQLDKRAITVTRAGRPIHLSPREFQLLVYFIEHADTDLPRDKILDDVWGYQSGTTTRTIDMHVANLRQKVEKDPTKPEFILTVARVGYRFVR